MKITSGPRDIGLDILDTLTERFLRGLGALTTELADETGRDIKRVHESLRRLQKRGFVESPDGRSLSHPLGRRPSRRWCLTERGYDYFTERRGAHR